ncbi:MAG: hypothetical protein HGGPFJEG_01724 [Ignavibacteria bacterium]|nr:hypothetical protein [Ignavibacteria bacterium]
MILSKEDAEKLLKKILSYSKAESASVSIRGNNNYNLRYALNSASTNGFSDSLSATITSNFGKKSGSIALTQFDDTAIENSVRKSEEIAKLTPDNKEFMPPLEKQSGYYEVQEFFEDTDNLTPESISDKISYTLEKADSQDLLAAGLFNKKSGFTALGNTKDLFAYHKQTFSNFSSTMRTKDSSGSSKTEKSYADVNHLNVRNLSDKVAERAVLSKNPRPYEPGNYVTILDYAAACDMLNNLSFYLNRRSADEGRSFFSDKERGNKIGQKIVNEKVTIYSDPQSSIAPDSPFTSEGLPVKRTNWISGGTLENLFMNRYWAEKKNSEPVPFPGNLIMEGSTKSLEDLIESTEKGIFVTRFWYIRQVDPKQALLTGLTRDGVFLIENGKITSAINNFRFNESPLNVLNNIIDMSTSEKSSGSETGDSKIVVPAMKLSGFNFSTVSDAI